TKLLAVAVAVGAIAVRAIAVRAIAVLGLRLVNRGARALRYRLAVGDVVAVPEQAIDDRLNGVLGIALLAIALLAVAVLLILLLRVLLLRVSLLVLLLILRRGGGREAADRRRCDEIAGEACHVEFPTLTRKAPVSSAAERVLGE